MSDRIVQPSALRWSDADLDRFRRVADPEADAIADRLFRAAGPAALGRLTRQLEDWEAPIPADAGADLHEFFERPVAYPGWVDPVKIARAEDLFVQYGPVTLAIILLNGFPRFLTNAAGARAFYMARIFSPDSLRRRMLALAQFVLYFTERGGIGQSWLSPAQAAAMGLPPHGVRKGRGMIALQKLRIIHANIRIMLRLADKTKADVTWDTAALGEPINQEDLAEAVLCFALCTIEGLRKVGIEQSADDKEAMLVAWKAAGVLLGLSDELQPDTLEEAIALRAAIYRRHSRKTHEGAVVANEVLHIIRGLAPPGSRRIPAALMRYQLGDEAADLLDLPNPRWILGAIALTRPVWERRHVFARLAMMVSPPLLHWVRGRDRAMTGVEVPQKLAERLGSEH